MNKNKIILILILVFILAILIAGISFFFIKKEKISKPKIERTELQLAHPELKIEDLIIGTGQKAEKGKKLTVHYTGKLEDGKVFDSTYNKNRPFSFVLGQGKVIPGWEIGIEGMKEGGKRKLTIPSQLGYGESGVRGMIPPNATIVFEIELIKVE